MNELHSHTEVEDLRQKVKDTYAWDFISCGADTIKESYQKLYEIVSIQCLRKNESVNTAVVIASEAVSKFLLVCHDSDWTCKNDKRDGITFIGDLRRSCGENGYHTGFHLYQDDKLGNEECLVINGPEVSAVKLFNCPVRE